MRTAVLLGALVAAAPADMAAPAPPFQAVTISNRGPDAMEQVIIVGAVDAAGAPSCLDPADPIVLSSRAEDASWRLEVTARPDGTLDRKPVEGTPPAEAVGPFRLAPP